VHQASRSLADLRPTRAEKDALRASPGGQVPDRFRSSHGEVQLVTA